MSDVPPNGEAILKAAEQLGLREARLVWGFGDVWSLQGVGKRVDHWPLAWHVAKELGISWGCGHGDNKEFGSHQVLVEQFVTREEL